MFQNNAKGQSSQDTISLAILWKFQTEKETINGLHFLYKIPLNSNLAPSPSMGSIPQGPKIFFEEFPLQLRFINPSTVHHNFETNPTCSVSMKLKLSNTSDNHVLSFRVEALNSDLSLNKERAGAKYFVWEGITDLEITDLKPMETCTIDFSLLFFDTGVYDISRFRFNFYINKRTGELAKNVSQTELVGSPNYERIVYTSERDQCLLSITN